MKKKQVSVSFNEETIAMLKVLADDDKRSVSNYVEQLVMVSINSDRDLKAEMNPCVSKVRRRLTN